MISTTNQTVMNALVAANKWHGNPYKCPYCGSTNGWTYDGNCKKCGRSLPKDKQADRINELIRRKLSVSNPQDIMNLARISGVPVDILRGKLGRFPDMRHGAGALKLKQKHGDQMRALERFRRRDNEHIGHTIAKGSFGPTTKRDGNGNVVEDPSRASITHGDYVGFFSKARKGRLTMTTHYKGAEDAMREDYSHKKAHR